MLMSPYKLRWRCARGSGCCGEHKLYARSHEHARYLFYTSDLGILRHTTIVSCELDVEQAEQDLAQFIFYRLLQQFDRPLALRRTRNILKKCLVQWAVVREAVLKIQTRIPA